MPAPRSKSISFEESVLRDGFARQVIEHLSHAVSEAKLVSPSVLAKAHPQLIEVYKNKYIRSLEVAIMAHRLEEPNQEAAQLWRQWEEWWEANKKDIRFPADVRK